MAEHKILGIVYGLNCVALLFCLCPESLSLQVTFIKGLHMDHRLRQVSQPWSCPRCGKLNPENYPACKCCFEPKVKRESEREQPSLTGKPATVTHHPKNVLMFSPDNSLAAPSSDRRRQYPQLLVLRCWGYDNRKG